MTIPLALASCTARVREFIEARASAGFHDVPASADEAAFDALARELFAIQFEHNTAYRRYCTARRVAPDSVKHWSEIPSIPTVAFKECELTCLPPAERRLAFHSSGTTGQRPSRHFHNGASLLVYEASLLAGFRRRFAPARTGPGIPPTSMLFLTPSPALAPHSSLVHMLDTLRRAGGVPREAFAGTVDRAGGWTLDLDRAQAGLESHERDQRPVIVLGTALGFRQLVEHLSNAGRHHRLPDGSAVMETGGYKGRSQTYQPAELHARITATLGVPARRIVGEYGMCELSSQAYQHDQEPTPPSSMQAEAGCFLFPPWARAQVISPETGQPVAEGEAGWIRVFDLANVASVLAVQTEDLGIRRGGGFELRGRAAAAEPRGCSLMAAGS